MRSGVLLLAVCLAAATPTADVGYADLPRLLATHPLHKVLAAYDREIAALRATRTIAELSDPGTRAAAAATALRRDAAAAQRQVQRIATAGATRDPTLEARALTAIRQSRSDANGAMGAYTSALDRETGANLRGYAFGMAQRTARGFAARQAQLREKELTLAYDLARRDAGTRLMLRLKLADLHLDRSVRARFEAQLAALNRRESSAVAALHAQDASVLARYREELERETASANAQMAAQIRSKANANLALRAGVARAASSSAAVVPDLPARLESFGASYRLGSDAQAIRRDLGAAATELPERFARLAGTDRESRADTSAQIIALQRDRAELYRAMLGEIERDARRLGEERGLRVILSGARPKGSVDLTGAVGREESSF